MKKKRIIVGFKGESKTVFINQYESLEEARESLGEEDMLACVNRGLELSEKERAFRGLKERI